MQFVSTTNVKLNADCTLLLATVSVGNVAQLACEVLLASFHHTLLGYLIDPNLLPCFGMEPFGQGSPCALSLELYQLEGTKRRICVLQQRAPAQIGRQGAFAKNLAKWIASSQFRDVLVLSSVEASIRNEQQLTANQSWYVHQKENAIPSGFQTLPDSILSPLLSGVLPPWPLWKELEDHGVVSSLLICFTVEGDNLIDGIQQAKEVNELLQLISTDQEFKPKLPVSVQWTYGPQR
eukprot:g1566.t1